MNNWAIYMDNDKALPVEVIKATAQMTTCKGARWFGDVKEFRTYSNKVLGGGYTEEQATKIAEQLNSASAERDKRILDARIWFEKRKAELTKPAVSQYKQEKANG